MAKILNYKNNNCLVDLKVFLCQAQNSVSFNEFMPDNYKVTTPFPADKDSKLSLLNKDGTCNKPSPAEAARNHQRGYRTGVGMLYWLSRNTMIALSTGLNYLSRVMAHPSDQAFECMLHMIQWCYQERDNSVMFHADALLTPTTWYDASNDTDGRSMQYLCPVLDPG